MATQGPLMSQSAPNPQSKGGAMGPPSDPPLPTPPGSALPPASKAKKPKAKWTDRKVQSIVDFLHERRSVCDGTGGFRTAVLRELVTHLTKSHPDLPPKNLEQVKTKWDGLKTTMRAVKDYIGRSGVHYDAVGGCNIQGVAAEAAWKDFLKTDNLAKEMKKFKTSGWPLYEKMIDICWSTVPRGAHSFSPSMHLSAASSVDDPEPAGDDTTEDGPANSVMSLANASSFTADNAASSTLISTSAPKRKADDDFDFTSDVEVSNISPSHSVPPSSTSARSSAAVSEKPPRPAKKSKSASKSGGTPSTRNDASSSRTSDKLTLVLLVHELQGTLNSLTSAVAAGLALDPAAETVRKAVDMLQRNEDGFSDEDCIMLLTIFTREPSYVHTYNGLWRQAFRIQWIKKVLEEEKQREQSKLAGMGQMVI
ncbi:hypothetical protein HWV62_18832 [Athelia sp. TMB]|nr:hypothetical protein HWV62_18832 [Athelia sp. TMB]